MTTGKTCTNKGCGKTYETSTNTPGSCRYHVKGPVFHEGLKGWGCCTKRVVGFDEFLEIEGCATGLHSDVVETPAPAPAPSTAAAGVKSKENPATEVYSTGGGGIVPSGPVVQVTKKPEPVVYVEENDADDVEIDVDTTCKRKGCEVKYKSNEISRGTGAEAECCYHPGEAIFHEGSKGWSCCSRKVLEFDEFLKIKGCRTGKHLFVGAQEEFVDCRKDWYQSPSTVSISIYAKKLDPAQVKISFETQKMLVDFVLPTKKKYRYHTELFQPIEPAKCSYRVLGTKVEVILQKSNGISWPAIEPTTNVKTWTTFGIAGKTGTVGGKEMMLSNDSPLLAMAPQ